LIYTTITKKKREKKVMGKKKGHTNALNRSRTVFFEESIKNRVQKNKKKKSVGATFGVAPRTAERW